MNGDAMRKPRMPWVQELTEYRPMGVLECCCTSQTDPIAVGWLPRAMHDLSLRKMPDGAILTH